MFYGAVEYPVLNPLMHSVPNWSRTIWALGIKVLLADFKYLWKIQQTCGSFPVSL